LRDTFLDFQDAFDPAAQPDPALERSWSRWETAAQKILGSATTCGWSPG